ncbi:nitroreductase family protein [bacterium]|nr:nitroreductase family protein [bacterium]
MSNNLDIFFKRRSIRKYQKGEIPWEHLAQILEATRSAPSAANRQPWHFVVVRDPDRKLALSRACHGQTWMADADCIICGIGMPSVSEKWYAVDVAIAMQTLVLAATALGYGTCWIGAFDEDAVKEVLEIPAEHRVIALTPLGIPAEQPAQRPRKPFTEVFSLDKFGNPLHLKDL